MQHLMVRLATPVDGAIGCPVQGPADLVSQVSPAELAQLLHSYCAQPLSQGHLPERHPVDVDAMQAANLSKILLVDSSSCGLST